MNATRYRKDAYQDMDVLRYMNALSEENSNTQEMERIKRRLRRAIREDVTEKQRCYLALYYYEGVNMVEISRRMGVHKSTVSRTIKRGEDKLRRCLRYGAGRLLPEGKDDDEADMKR